MDQDNKNRDELTPQQRYSKAEIDDILADDPDEAPTEWVPTRFEKRVNAIPEKTWVLYQILGGGLVGALVVVALFMGGAGLNAGFLISVVLALLLPNWLEDRGRRKLYKARYAMIAVIAVGIAAMVIYNGVTKGLDSFTIKKTEEAAARAWEWMIL